jgi:TatD DNase family protein
MQNPLIDTHAHLNFSPFIENPEPYLERAYNNGIRAVIVPGVDIASSEKAVRLADRFPMVYAAAGLHPEDSPRAPDDYLKQLEAFYQHDKCVAVGEIGVDFYRDYAPPDVQERFFYEQAELAKSLELPMIIHNRQADNAILSVLDRVGYYTGQCHCFTGKAPFAQTCIDKGLLISFTGIVTFSNEIAATVSALPLQSLMIETDSPFMAPVPWRGKTNEPSFVVKVAETYAQLFNVTLEDVARISTGNALNLFHKLKTDG